VFGRLPLEAFGCDVELFPALGRLLDNCRSRATEDELFTEFRLAASVLFRPTAVAAPTVRTGMWEAPAAGAVRAITARFCTDVGGTTTRPRALAAPVKLAFVGVSAR